MAQSDPDYLKQISEEIQWERAKDRHLMVDVNDRPVARVSNLAPMRMEWYRPRRFFKPRVIGRLALVTFAWREQTKDHNFQAYAVLRQDDTMYAFTDDAGQYMKAALDFIGTQNYPEG